MPRPFEKNTFGLLRGSRYASIAVVALACAIAFPTAARAGIAWGDASLKTDDVRVEVDAAGRATVSHAISIHVASKKFRAFVVEGVDADPMPPLDDATTAGLDGPGWPVEATNAKGEPIEAFVEPTKEPRRLHVRLGSDGVPRGDYALKLRYRVDLGKDGAFSRDGTMLRLSWGAPSWPEGYDSGHLVFAIPSAPTEPRVAIDDGANGIRPIDGAALLSTRRGTSFDELELTRPHVPHHDDARWVLTLDPKALPDVAATLALTPTVAAAAVDRSSMAGRFWSILGFGSALLAAVAGASLRRRDRDALREATARGVSLRPLLPLSIDVRALMFGALVGASTATTLLHAFHTSALLLVAAIATSILRAPLPPTTAEASGRWLAIPESATPKRASPTGWFDLGGVRGRVLATSLSVLAIAACAWCARGQLRWSVALAMHALVGVALFASGRVAQLPRDLAQDAWPILRRIARVLLARRIETKVIGRAPRRANAQGDGARRAIDELRLRIDPSERASAAGLLAIEIGCGVHQGAFAPTMIPELLVRCRRDGVAARALEAKIARAKESATFAIALGRSSEERTIAIRPALTSPSSLRRWVEWIAATVDATALQPSDAKASDPRLPSVRAMRRGHGEEARPRIERPTPPTSHAAPLRSTSL